MFCHQDVQLRSNWVDFHIERILVKLALQHPTRLPFRKTCARSEHRECQRRFQARGIYLRAVKDQGTL